MQHHGAEPGVGQVPVDKLQHAASPPSSLRLPPHHKWFQDSIRSPIESKYCEQKVVPQLDIYPPHAHHLVPLAVGELCALQVLVALGVRLHTIHHGISLHLANLNQCVDCRLDPTLYCR